MKAIAADRLDSFADYRLVDVPAVSPGPTEVRIRIAAVGLGYVDALIARGGYQVKPDLPHIPGVEVAGTVDAVGPGVTGWAPGDRVLAMTRAGLAEQALASAAACRPIPAGISFAQAAAFPLNHLTALHGLADRGRLHTGETLLVFGAAGGVGAAAIAVGKQMGATVIAAASSPEKRSFALAHGADHAIDTDPDGWRDRLRALLGDRRLDVILDPVMGPLFQLAFRSLGWGGRHLVVGFVGGPIPAFPANLALMKGAGLVGVDVRQFQLFEQPSAARHLDTLLAWLGDGRLPPPAVREFSWAEAPAALSEALKGQMPGKVVLVT
jgi:NADPH:quinone reductase